MGGKGDKNKATIAVVFSSPGENNFFPQTNHLLNVCKWLKINPQDIYVTPFIKNKAKLIMEHYDILETELRGLPNLKVVWLLGQETLKAIGHTHAVNYFRYTYGMYMPFLIDGLFALLVPDEREMKEMPEQIASRMTFRLENAVMDLNGATKFVKPRDETRADIFMFKLMEERGYVNDPSLATKESYAAIWSSEIRDHIIVLATEEAKAVWLELGFGLIFCKQDFENLKEDEMKFLIESMRVTKSRTAWEVKK